MKNKIQESWLEKTVKCMKQMSRKKDMIQEIQI
jgi:hypothetical protein